MPSDQFLTKSTRDNLEDGFALRTLYQRHWRDLSSKEAVENLDSQFVTVIYPSDLGTTSTSSALFIFELTAA